jgi:hypothetical protein
MERKLKYLKAISTYCLTVALIIIALCSSCGFNNGNSEQKTSTVDELLQAQSSILTVDTPPSKHSDTSRKDTNSRQVKKKKTLKKDEKKKKATQVLICKSRNSYAYHSHQCSGLRRCKAGIESISQTQAENQGRRPCKFCY